MGTLLFFACKGRGISCRVPLALTIIAGHLLAGLMEEFDAQCQFTTTMGADAYGTSLFAFVYYLIVLFPGLCVCLFINSVWKGIPKHIAHLSEALIYLLLAGGLLGLCVMLIISPFN